MMRILRCGLAILALVGSHASADKLGLAKDAIGLDRQGFEFDRRCERLERM